MRGEVTSEPRLIQREPSEFAAWGFLRDRTSFTLDVSAIQSERAFVPASGRVQVYVREAVLDLHEGERVELVGWLAPLHPPRNPGSFNWAAYLRRQGIGASVTVHQKEGIVRIDSATSSGIGDLVHRFRSHVRHMLVSDLTADTDQQQSLLEAMVIGHRSRLDRRLNEVFINAGCIHFLAVSGVHLVIVMLIARLLCRVVSLVRILLGSPSLGLRTRTWFLIVAIILYVLVAEPRPPILRAGIIALTYCVAVLLGRASARLNWISFAVLVLAIIDPGMVFDVGYQLSTIAVLGVCHLAPTLEDAWRSLRLVLGTVPEPIGDAISTSQTTDDNQTVDTAIVRHSRLSWSRVALAVRRAVCVAIAAWIVTAPITAWHFGRIQPWGSLNSLLVLPVVTVVMGLAFAKLILTGIAPSLGAALAAPLEFADSWLIGMVNWLSELPGSSVFVPKPSLPVVLASYALILSLVLFVRSRTWRPLSYLLWRPEPSSAQQAQTQYIRPLVSHWWPLVAAFSVLVTTVTWIAAAQHRGQLIITALAVGAGAVHVIELPDGQPILFDAGSMAHPDVGRRVVVPFLRTVGIRRIDRAYVSHPNVDHFNGLPGIIEQIDTGPIVINKLFRSNAGARSPGARLLKTLNDGGHELIEFDATQKHWELGGARFELLWPPDKMTDPLSANDTSTVLRISHAGHSILLTGDIEERAESALLERGDLQADVLVLPHHGGVESTTQAFIDAVGARVLIRSTHQTRDETSNGLLHIIGDRTLYSTADDGAIRIVINEDGVRVETYGGNRFERRGIAN